MSQVKRMLACIMTLCMLMSLTSVAAQKSDDGKYWVRDVMIPSDPDRAVVWAMAEEDCLLILALYDRQERMLWSEMTAVTGSAEDQRISLKIPADRPEGSVFKAFLLNPENYAPLCEELSFAHLTEEDGFAITHLYFPIDGDYFSAEVTTSAACELNFQILSEDGMTELYSTVEDLDGGLTMESVYPQHWFEGELPESYLLRAVLRDKQGRPLCNPYTDRSNTASHRAFAALTEEDFPADRVLDLVEEGDSNFAVLHPEVLRLETSDTVNVLVKRKDGVSTFTNADATLIGLKPGDKISFCDMDGQYATAKVTTVQTEGSTVTVTEDMDSCLADFYAVIKIDVELQGVAPETEASLQEVELLGAQSSLPSTVFGLNMGPQIGTEVNTPFGAVEAEIRAGGDFKLYYNHDSKYVEGGFQTATVGQMKLTIGPNSNKKSKTNLLDIPLTGLKDIADISLNLDIEYDVDCKGGLSTTFTMKQTAGYIYNSRDGSQVIKKNNVNQDDMTTEATVAFDFDVSAGLKASLNAAVLDDMVQIGLGTGAGVGAKGRMETQVIPDLATMDSYHACDWCISANAYGYLEVEMTADYNILPGWSGTLIDLDFIRAEATIGNFYHSLANEANSVHGGQPVFAWEEECPNRKYQTQVLTYNTKDEEVMDCDVTILNSSDQTVAAGASSLTVYLYPSSYTAKATVERNAAEAAFTVKNEPVRVVLRGMNFSLRGTINNAVTGDPVSGVSVKAEENSEIMDTSSTGDVGTYSLSLPAGSFRLTFSAEGYDSETKDVTLTENMKLDVTLEPKEYTVSFGASEGSGSMENVIVVHDQKYILPDNGFTAPEGKYFKGWSIGGKEYPAGGVYGPITGDLTVTAVWKDGTLYPVTVKVLNADGTSADGVAINGTGLPDTPYTGANGTVTFNLVAETYTLSATTYNEKTKYTASQTIVVDGEESVTLTLKNELVWEYNAETRVLEIYGDGPMPYYSSVDKIPWRNVQADEVRLYGVTTISQQALAYRYLDRVVLPEGLTQINWYAFYDTVIYEPLILPNSLEIIVDKAFYDGSVKIAEFPAGLKKIGAHAFSDALWGVETITIPGNVTEIGGGAFFHCGMKNVIIEEGVTKIGSVAFAHCWLLESVTIPTSVTKIGAEAFDCNASSSATPEWVDLKDVYYAGTEEQWNAIEISSSGNEPLLNATIHFESTGPEN